MRSSAPSHRSARGRLFSTWRRASLATCFTGDVLHFLQSGCDALAAAYQALPASGTVEHFGAASISSFTSNSPGAQTGFRFKVLLRPTGLGKGALLWFQVQSAAACFTSPSQPA